ncbi:MAG: LamG domain-containing protein [Aureispira sp.]|nr:LamG domain-containing protein [Aureispira sp.]
MNLISRSFFIVLCLISFQLNAQEASLWEINEGEGPIDFPTSDFGDQKAYEKVNIPPFDGPGWSLAGKVLSTEEPNKGKMVVGFNRTSKIAGGKHKVDCLKKVDFTYFKTQVFIPANMTISEFNIYYDWADDGARVYLFNSDNPNGYFNSDFDLVLGDNTKKNPQNIDFANQAKAGEVNTVIIAQFDNCGKGNSVRGIHIKVNGAEVEPQKTITKPTNTPMAKLIGHWTFEDSLGIDLTGNFSDLEMVGDAHVYDGKLKVGKDAFAQSTSYQGASVKEKTLVAWVRIDDENMRGGSALTLGRVNNNWDFDAIVYAERQPKTWMNGSGYYKRTKDLGNKALETNLGTVVKMAITYAKGSNNQTDIKVYRNGVLIGAYSQGTLLSYDKSNIGVMFGKRHFWKGMPSNPFIDASIDEARIYKGVLTQEQIEGLTAED